MHLRSLSLSRLSSPRTRGSRLLAYAALAATLLLSGCGFHLQRAEPLAFQKLYIGIGSNTQLGDTIRRMLAVSSPNTQIVSSPKSAQALLQIVRQSNSILDVALDADGQVSEYELTVIYVFRLVDSQGRALLPDTTLTRVRDLPYTNNALQADQAEMNQTFQIMRDGLAGDIVRRISSPDVQQAYLRFANSKTTPDGVPLYDPTVNPSSQTPPNWNQPQIVSNPNAPGM